MANNTDTVTTIRTATNRAGRAVTVGIGPVAIAITLDGKTAYVAGIDGTVSPIRTATNTVGRVIGVGMSPSEFAIAGDGKTACVASQGSCSVVRSVFGTDARHARRWGGSSCGFAGDLSIRRREHGHDRNRGEFDRPGET